MKKIFQYLENICVKNEISQEMIGQIIGVSPASVSNYFNGKQEIKFIAFLNLINYLMDDHNEKLKLIYDFCIGQKKYLESDRIALEWSSNNSEFRLQELLINKMSQNSTNKTHAEPYKLLLKRNLDNIDRREFLAQAMELNKKKYTKIETQIIQDITFLYALWNMGGQSFDTIKYLADSTLKKINQISSKDALYLKTSFRIRVYEVLANLHLKANEISEVKKICLPLLEKDNIEHFPSPAISLYRVLAESLIFSDVKSSINYIKESINILRRSPHNLNEYKKNGIETTSDHLRIIAGLKEGLYLNDESELAHYYAMNGNKNSALKILNKIEDKNQGLSAHQLYYKALALEDKELMDEARKAFYKNGDSFYAQLPERYIKYA